MGTGYQDTPRGTMPIQKLKHWITDYLHAIRKQGEAFLSLKPPTHYLGRTTEGKSPIILIPGILEKWHFLSTIADPLSFQGHPIYALENLGYNLQSISAAAKIVRQLLDEKDLKNVVIICHSKGGLIGKYVLAHLNQDGRVKKVIAIASPFGGTRITRMLPHKAMRELSPESETIRHLGQKKEINKDIVSIFGSSDNHVWPVSSCYLDGAQNIQIDEAHGHHDILSDNKVIDIISSIVET